MAIVFRVVGYLLLASSVLIAGSTLLLWLNGKDLARPGGEVWVVNHPNSYSQIQRGIQQFIAPDLWDKFGVPYLELPAWLGLGIACGAGLIMASLFLLGGHRAKLRSRRKKFPGGLQAG